MSSEYDMPECIRSGSTGVRRNRGNAPSNTDNNRDAGFQPKSASTSSAETGSGSEQRAGNLAEELAKTARGLTQSISAQARDLMANVGEELATTVEDRVGSGAEALLGFAKAMETAAAELDSKSPQVARRVREAAGQVESLSGTI